MIQRMTVDLRNLFKMSLILMECVAQDCQNGLSRKVNADFRTVVNDFKKS